MILDGDTSLSRAFKIEAFVMIAALVVSLLLLVSKVISSGVFAGVMVACLCVCCVVLALVYRFSGKGSVAADDGGDDARFDVSDVGDFVRDEIILGKLADYAVSVDYESIQSFGSDDAKEPVFMMRYRSYYNPSFIYGVVCNVITRSFSWRKYEAASSDLEAVDAHIRFLANGVVRSPGKDVPFEYERREDRDGSVILKKRPVGSFDVSRDPAEEDVE